jgi:integrase
MASVHRRPKSAFWHAAFRGPDGRLILRSTKQQDRHSALAMAMEFERAAKLARRGELVETQAREVLGDIMKRANIRETLQTVTIKAHLTQWLASKTARKAEATAVRYNGVTTAFLAFMGERANKPLTSLTSGDVERFLDMRLKNGVSPRTAVCDVKTIRAALNQARRQGIIPTNPAEALELPDVVGMERGTLTPAEVKMLVDNAEGEWKTLIMVGYFTGARLIDCCRMQWEDVDLSAESLTYVQGKTGGKITIPLHPDLLAYLEQLAGTDQPAQFIAPHMANLKSGGRHGLSEGFKRIMVKAGLDVQRVQGKGKRMMCRRTFHALRHSFTSGLANQQVSPEVRMKLTGHKSDTIHAGYTHHELKTLAKAMKKLPGLGNMKK